MRTSIVCIAGVVLFVSCLGPLGQLRAAVALPDPNGPPATLVQAALQAELDGPSELRQKLLDQALARDPEFAPARWQLGFVRWDGGWLHVDDVPKRAANDKSLTAYRSMRDAMVDTADNHRAAAKWCHKNKLADEERIHWTKVLEFESGDAEALAALGLQLHEGRLLTRQQIEQEKQNTGDRLRANQHWRPQIVKWRNSIEHGSQKDRRAALEKLRALSDPGGITPLESIFAVTGDSKNAVELNLLLIDTVGRMPLPEATQVLLRRAIMPDSIEIRTAAADQLKKRPMHAYVPQLIAALPGKLKTRFHVYVLPNGMVLHEHELLIEGRDVEMSMRYESVVNPTDAWTAMFITPRAANRELLRANEIESRAQLTDQQNKSSRERIQFVLERTTGFANVDDPRLWEQQYNEYAERYELQPTRSRRVARYEYNYESYTVPQYSSPPVPTAPKPHVATAAENAAAAASTKQWLADYQKYYGHPFDPNHPSCFPAGTPIATLTGTLPIEKIKIGDRVLSQNPQNGELAYKPVQGVTLRPAAPLVEIGMGTERIRATRGHPFWVNGQGWLMAKQLQAGDFLHTLHGAAPIDRIGEAPAAEAYNLVVSEFNTYFVGDVRALVHDNLPLNESAALVPGLSTQQP